MIRTTDADTVAVALRNRYDSARAITLIGRMMLKALFAGQSNEVLFWGLVHARYRADDLCNEIEQQLAAVMPEAS